MENERDFLIIENLTQEEINESFEKLKKNLLRTFYEFRKRKNTDVKILDINYSTEKFIKINIDGIFLLKENIQRNILLIWKKDLKRVIQNL